VREEALKTKVKQVHADNYAAFGARKMQVMLNQSQVAEHHGAGCVARCTLEHLMYALGMHDIRRATPPRTTRSAVRDQCPTDLVGRHF
jgi:putative transposase